MVKKRISLILVLLVCCAICYGAAVTSSPYTGAGWNESAPNNEAILGNSYQELQDLRKGVGLRMIKEHEKFAASSAGGVHKQGSARAFFQDAAPGTQVDGSAFDSNDLGSLWFDANASPDNQFNVLTATTPTWTPISTEIIAVLLAATRQFAVNVHVDKNVGIGTTTPKVIASWAGTDDATMLNVYNGTYYAKIVAQGNTGGILDLVDLGGDPNDKWFNVEVDGGIVSFSSVDDDGIAYVVQHILQLDLGTGNATFAGTLTVDGSQSGAADHVFDAYNDIELLEKWRAGEELPFKTGDILNRDRLLRDAIVQQNKLIKELEVRIGVLEKK